MYRVETACTCRARPLIPVAALLGQAAAKTAPDRLNHYIVLSC
jgi:hypothetical protein